METGRLATWFDIDDAFHNHKAIWRLDKRCNSLNDDRQPVQQHHSDTTVAYTGTRGRYCDTTQRRRSQPRRS